MEKKPEARPGSLDNQFDAAVIWRYMAPAGHTIEDCCRSDYWRNVIREVSQQRINQRHAFNRIEILAEDGTWEAEIRIMAVDGHDVTARLLRQWPEPTKAVQTKVEAPEGYTVEHVSGNGWRALEPGGTTLIEKRTTRDEALNRALDHSRKAQTKGAR